MTAKEYLSQAKFLDLKINHHIRRKEELHRLACSISSPVMQEDKVQTSPSGEAPYVRTLMKVMEMEEKINAEIDLLVDLKEQMNQVIEESGNAHEIMTLRLHYIDGLSFTRIAEDMFVDVRTIKRWHKSALAKVRIPKDAIVA